MKLNTKRTFRFIWKHVKAYKSLASLMIFAIVMAVGLGLVVPYFYKLFFDLLVSDVTREQIAPQLIRIIAIIAGIYSVQWVFWRITNFSNDFFQPRVMMNIMNEGAEYLQGHSYRFFSNHFMGSLVRKVGRLARAFEGITDKIYWDLIPLVLRVVIIFGILFYIQPAIGIAMLVWTIFFVGFNYAFSLYKLKYDIAKAKADTKISGALADTLTNNINVKLFASLDWETKHFNAVTEDAFKKNKKSWNLGSIAEAVQTFFMVMLEFIIFYFAIKYWKQDLLTVGDFVWIQAYLIDLFIQLWNFGRIIRDLYERLADAEEMIEILNEAHEIKDIENAPAISVTRGKIELKAVDFSYDQERSIIHDFNLTIKPSEKVALIGPSGGGKSTITKLLMRFFDIQKGHILIDGQDVAQVTQDSLRASVSFVPQDPILFHRSLMDNIRYGRRDASDEEVIMASKMANCHEFIQNFPQQYETFVGERGIKLSGGERQRVAIARAILANTPILVLDEATSALDSESELLIQQGLEKLMKNKTTIVIAHRLSTIMRMDRIVVIQEGGIVEEGAHAELIKKDSGLYKKLWNLQVGGYVGN